MIGQELIINFEDDKAHLTPDKFLLLNQLDLPSIVNRFLHPASWKVLVIGHNAIEKRIFVEVLSYMTTKESFPYNQRFPNKELNEIEKIGFKSIDTFGLLGTLNGSRSRSEPRTIFPTHYKNPENEERQQPFSIPTIKREPIHRTINETFYVLIKNIHFKSGYVSFEKRIPQLNQTLEFTVLNNNIREEFDAVKGYFGKALKTKNIRFDVTIKLTDNKITNTQTKSPEIDQIDEDLIESVKFDFVRSIPEKKLESDNGPFTIDQLFETLFNEKIKPDLFLYKEESLVKDLLEITKSKHYKHLNWLSSQHAHVVMKLRFILKPFSFIFLIEGDSSYHFIWETLNTEEATYIWHEEKNISKLKPSLKKIGDVIGEIKVHGKTAYIKSSEDNFKRIYHDYSESVDGFAKWKNELESILV